MLQASIEQAPVQKTLIIEHPLKYGWLEPSTDSRTCMVT